MQYFFCFIKKWTAISNALTSVVEVVGMVVVVVVVAVVKVVVIVIEAISIVHSFLSPWYNQRGQNRRGSCGPAAPVPRLPRVIKEGNLSAKELRRIRTKCKT